MNVAGGASKEAEQEREQGSARTSFAAGGGESTASEAGILLLHEERASVPACNLRRPGSRPSQAQRGRNSSTPLPMGLVSFPKVIMPAFVGSCVLSYAFWDLTRNRKIFGGQSGLRPPLSPFRDLPLRCVGL